MSRSKKLIQKSYFDVDKISLYELGEICDFKYGRGNAIPEQRGEYPVYGCNGIVGITNEYNSEDAPIIGHIGSAGVVNWGAGKHFVTYNGTICLANKAIIYSKYLFYLLVKLNLPQYVKGSQPFLSYGDFSKIRVAIPSLKVQSKIVYILDSFAELIAELTAELAARKKQYEYYQTRLLSKNFGTPNISLADICMRSCSGATPKKGNNKYYDGGTIPWLRTQEVRFNEIYETAAFITEAAVNESAVKWIPENCVIVAISGASAGRCAVNKIPMTTNQHCLNMEINPKIAMYKYVFYCLCNQYEELKSKKEGARGDLNASRILSLKIPVPSLEEQEMVVRVLDSFHTFLNDFTYGLPAEIKARKKQYEYYRNKLLTFEEKEA